MQPTVDPMLLTDQEFEAYRNITDQAADKVAFAILNLFDHGQIYRILSSLEKNTDTVSFNVLEKLSYETKGDPEVVKTLINITKKWIDDYFNDLTLFRFTPEEKECLRKAAMFFNTHMTECTLALAT